MGTRRSDQGFVPIKANSISAEGGGMSYDELPPEVISKGRIGFLSDWFADWLGLIDILCLLFTFSQWCPQLEQRFYSWNFRKQEGA